MPGLDEERLGKLKSAQNTLQMRLNSLTELPKATEDDPAYVLTFHKLNKINKLLQDHYDANRPVDENGKLTEDAQSVQPIRTEPQQPQASFTEAVGRNYFFEPSVEEVQHRLRNEPELVDRLDKAKPDLGIRKELEMAQPAYRTFNVGPMDPATGSTMNAGVQPTRMGVDALTSNSSAYKAVSDDMWDERLRDAQAKGINLERYSKVKLDDEPLNFLEGGIQKGIRRVAYPAAMVVGDALTLGTGISKGNTVKSELRKSIPGFAEPDIDMEAVERTNPLIANIARIGAYMLPQQPTNALTTAALEAAGHGAMKFGGRVATTLAAGGLGNAFENLVRNTANGQSVAEAGRQIPGDIAWGSALAGAGEALIGPLREYRQNVRESVTDPDRRTLINARGDTAIFGDNLSGYKAPIEMREDIREAGGFRHLGTAGDRAAERVAPKIQKSLDKQLADETARQAAQNKAYFRHPEYSEIEEPGQEAVDAVLELAETGWITGAIDKKPTNVDAATIERVGDAVGRIAQMKPFVNLKQAEQYAQKTGGKVIDGYTAKLMFPNEKMVGRNYAVVVASSMNAESLTALERSIDDVLKMSNKKGMENEPVYGRFQQAIKPVRDRFNLYVDADGNLVSPPQGVPGNGPQAPTVAPRARRAAPPPAQPQQPQQPIAAPPLAQPQQPQQPIAGTGTTINVPVSAAQIQRQTGLPYAQAQALADQMNAATRPPQQLPPPHPQLSEGQESAIASTEPASTSADPTQPGAPVTPQVDPSTLAPEDYYLDPSTLDPRDYQRAYEPTLEDVKDFFPGISPSSAQRVVDRLNGRTFATVDLDPNDLRAVPPETAPEYTPKEPSALSWNDVEELPESIQSADVRELPPETEPNTQRSIAPDYTYPTPDAKEWEQSGNDADQWFEGIVRPGAPARSAEAQRVADLVEQQRGSVQQEGPEPSVEEAAGRAAHWLDAIFAGGERPSDSTRAQMIAKSVAHQIGRALTSQEAKDIAKFIIPVAVGSKVGEAIDEEGGGGVGAMAGGLFSGAIRGKPMGPYPHQPEATLPNGNKVTGFSALRNQQHEALNRLDEAGAGLGADREKNVLRKVLNFNQYSGTPEDKILLEEADRLGLTEDLYRAAATMAYGRLRGQGQGGKVSGNDRNILVRVFGPRFHALAGMLTGEPSTYGGRQGIPEQGFRELLNLSGGRLGSRFGSENDLIRDYLNQVLLGGAPYSGRQDKKQKEDQR